MWREKMIDLIIPLVLITVCSILIFKGIDGEVKAILTMAGVWAFRAVVVKSRK